MPEDEEEQAAVRDEVGAQGRLYQSSRMIVLIIFAKELHLCSI